MSFVSFTLGIGLVALWIAGLVSAVPGWLAWLDMAAAVAAFALAAAYKPKSKHRAWGLASLGLAAAVGAIWLIGLSTSATPWLTWGNFFFACAFLLEGLGTISIPQSNLWYRRRGTYGNFYGLFPGTGAGDMGYPYGWGFGWGPYNIGAPYDGSLTGHYGKGPKSYQRSDARIEEELNEQLTRHWSLDATEIEVKVEEGVVRLVGAVRSRRDRQLAEAIADSVYGVLDVRNDLEIHSQHGRSVRAA